MNLLVLLSNPLQTSIDMKTKTVIGDIFKGLLHVLLRIFLLLIWALVKVVLIVFGKIQQGLEAYLQRTGK